MLTSKQRSQLRAMANSIESSYHIGKDGVTPVILSELHALLEARELIKITVNKNSSENVETIMEIICQNTNADPVSKLGNKIVVFRKSKKNNKIKI